VEFLERVSTIVEPVLGDLVVTQDPDDDAVIYTAVEGRADVLCTRDTHFYATEVIAFCRLRGIEIMNDVKLLHGLRHPT
jgi:predicted nucleic acid-binding protein